MGVSEISSLLSGVALFLFGIGKQCIVVIIRIFAVPVSRYFCIPHYKLWLWSFNGNHTVFPDFEKCVRSRTRYVQ